MTPHQIPVEDDLLAGDGPIPSANRDVLARVNRSITRIVDCKPDPIEPDSFRVTVSVTCPDTPGMLAGVTEWLWKELDGNIVSSFGGRMDGDIHGSFFTIRTRTEQLVKIISEVHMNEVKPGNPPNQDELKTYELTVTAPDRLGIFCEVSRVLTDREINILSQSVVTGESPKGSGHYFAHIRLRMEVPLRTVPSLPQVIDKIRELGRDDDGWHVTEPEPTENKGFSLPLMTGLAQLN